MHYDKKNPKLKQRIVYRQCSSKKSYYTTQELNKTIRFLRRKFPTAKYSYYRCPICKKYHITTSKEWKENGL